MFTEFQLDDLSRQFPDVSRSQIQGIIAAWATLPTVALIEVVSESDGPSDSEASEVEEASKSDTVTPEKEEY